MIQEFLHQTWYCKTFVCITVAFIVFALVLGAKEIKQQIKNH